MHDDGRRLLINCDDLGYHPTVNEAIVEILSNGIVRSASIMPAAPHFDDAVRRVAAAGMDALGVHLTIGSEYSRLPIGPVSDPSRVPSLVDDAGWFFSDLATIRDRARPEEVAEEFHRQIERVAEHGIRITHLDGHLFCYEDDVGGAPLRAVAEQVAVAHDLPLRCRTPSRCRSLPRSYMFWVGADTVAERIAAYDAFLHAYDDPVAELIIHPGKDLDRMREFSRTGERRLADYVFFRGSQFADLVRSRDLRVVTWAEI